MPRARPIVLVLCAACHAGPPASSPGPKGLSAEQARAAVDAHKPSLMRRCRPVADACRDGGDCSAGPVRVQTSIAIARTGAVVDVRTSGEGEDLMECVRATIGTWTFPEAAGTTTINVAFRFL